jgi:DNA-binding CsgD family transcriptional regulator
MSMRRGWDRYPALSSGRPESEVLKRAEDVTLEQLHDRQVEETALSVREQFQLVIGARDDRPPSSRGTGKSVGGARTEVAAPGAYVQAALNQLPYCARSRLAFAAARFDTHAYARILESQALPKPLTQHQLILLELVRRGLSNREIADRLGNSPSTNSNTIKTLKTRFRVKDRSELIEVATALRTEQ